MKLRGLFITFEGGEGCGKTTQIQHLAFRIKNITSAPFVVTREPGGVPAAELIREIMVNSHFSRLMSALKSLRLKCKK